MRRYLKLLSIPLVAGGVLITGCNREGGSAADAAPARAAPSVTAAAAIARDVPVYLDAIGKTVSPEVVTIVPQVGGKVTETFVTDGAYVRKGDVLFKIDSRPYDAELASAKATLKQNESELVLAQAEPRSRPPKPRSPRQNWTSNTARFAHRSTGAPACGGSIPATS